MINYDDIIEDPMDDEVGLLIRDVISGTTWNAERHRMRDILFEKLKALNYYPFQGHIQRYHLQRVGQSYLYRVPETKRGHLEKFRGKLIRVVCIGKDKTLAFLRAKVYQPPLLTSQEKPKKRRQQAKTKNKARGS